MQLLIVVATNLQKRSSMFGCMCVFKVPYVKRIKRTLTIWLSTCPSVKPPYLTDAWRGGIKFSPTIMKFSKELGLIAQVPTDSQKSFSYNLHKLKITYLYGTLGVRSASQLALRVLFYLCMHVR